MKAPKKSPRQARLEPLVELVAAHGGALGGALFALEPACCMRRLPGRETFLVDLSVPLEPRALAVAGDAAGLAELPGPVAVVKRFATSDAREARAELLRGRLPRSPAQREAENLAGLLTAGIPVPEPLFWCEAGAASLVLLEYLPHPVTLRQLVEAGEPDLAERSDELAVLVAQMHAAGWCHRDLYLEHLVVTVDGQLALLDGGRARERQPLGRRWVVKDLAALGSSLPAASDRLRARFLARYLAAASALEPARAPRTRTAQRRLAARIAKKERRIRAHVPRHVHG